MVKNQQQQPSSAGSGEMKQSGERSTIMDKPPIGRANTRQVSNGVDGKLKPTGRAANQRRNLETDYRARSNSNSDRQTGEEKLSTRDLRGDSRFERNLRNDSNEQNQSRERTPESGTAQKTAELEETDSHVTGETPAMTVIIQEMEGSVTTERRGLMIKEMTAKTHSLSKLHQAGNSS